MPMGFLCYGNGTYGNSKIAIHKSCSPGSTRVVNAYLLSRHVYVTTEGR